METGYAVLMVRDHYIDSIWSSRDKAVARGTELVTAGYSPLDVAVSEHQVDERPALATVQR